MNLKEKIKKYLKGKYKTSIKCENCKVYSSIYIERGVSVKEYMLSGKCPNCGVKYHEKFGEIIKI